MPPVTEVDWEEEGMEAVVVEEERHAESVVCRFRGGAPGGSIEADLRAVVEAAEGGDMGGGADGTAGGGSAGDTGEVGWGVGRGRFVAEVREVADRVRLGASLQVDVADAGVGGEAETGC